MSTETPKLRGVDVTLADGQAYTVPPLNFDQLERLTPQLQFLQQPKLSLSKESRDGMLDIFHAALSRNYPELKREQMGELVDLAAAAELVAAVCAANQFRELQRRIEDGP